MEESPEYRIITYKYNWNTGEQFSVASRQKTHFWRQDLLKIKAEIITKVIDPKKIEKSEMEKRV